MERNVDIDTHDMNIYSGLPTTPTLSFSRQTNKLKTLKYQKLELTCKSSLLTTFSEGEHT